MAGDDRDLTAHLTQDVYNRSPGAHDLSRSTTRIFFKLTWIYELPIGPGKAINVGGVAGKFDWRLEFHG